MPKIVLVNPDIPQNTGNIGRLCVGLDWELHLVHPMGFVISDKQIRRTGLDYWEHLKVIEHNSLTQFLEKHGDGRLFFYTTKTQKVYTHIHYEENDFLIFGSESRGLPEDLLEKYKEQTCTIPMPGKVRSLNLANSVSVVAYEAYRQLSL
ncbi:MAG: tRNA (cytidine(34)-2'-O)-methyltransferase [bacterium]|nr:tRNA (cytidine(34)-2'-O)-methyltransferase [bacterium]MBU1918405.1 tRNA (cytidine(34)-2'-O)-methyltransferase [bacterium]